MNGRVYFLLLAPVAASLLVIMAFGTGCSCGEPMPTPTPTPTSLPVSDFEEFESMDLSEFMTLQMKLTYVGEQSKVVPTVAITADSHDLDMDCFKPFRKTGVDYGNDEVATVVALSVTTEELQGIIGALGVMPAVKEGAREGQFLSFMMCNKVDGQTKGFEAIVDASDAEALLRTIVDELEPDSDTARQTLEDYMESLF